MATDRELLDVLREHGLALDRNSKAHYLNYMATEKMMEDRTPATFVGGMMALNQVALQQIVPRNNRRKEIRFTYQPSTINGLLILSNIDTLDVNSLFQAYKNVNGMVQAYMIAPGAVTPFKIDSIITSDAFFAASINVTSAVNLVSAIPAYLTWTESVYDDKSASPMNQGTNSRHGRPHEEQHLARSSQAEKIAGPVTTGYTHDGVR